MITTGLAVIALAIAAFSQDPWVRHESPDGGFSVLIPDERMTRGSRRVEGDGGGAATLNSFAVNNGLTRYIATYYDVDRSMNFSLKRARDGIVRKLNGKIASETSAQILGIPTRTFRVHTTANGHELTVNARIFFTGSRVFLLQVIFPRAYENTPAEDRVRWYFNSFTIKNGAGRKAGLANDTLFLRIAVMNDLDPQRGLDKSAASRSEFLWQASCFYLL